MRLTLCIPRSRRRLTISLIGISPALSDLRQQNIFFEQLQPCHHVFEDLLSRQNNTPRQHFSWLTVVQKTKRCRGQRDLGQGIWILLQILTWRTCTKKRGTPITMVTHETAPATDMGPQLGLDYRISSDTKQQLHRRMLQRTGPIILLTMRPSRSNTSTF